MIPEDVLAAWREAGRRSLPDYEAWQARVAALPADKRRTLDRLREGRLPEGWEAPLRAFKRRAGEERLTESGIKTSGDILGPADRRHPGAAVRRAGPGGRRRSTSAACAPSRQRTAAAATSITASASTRWARC